LNKIFDKLKHTKWHILLRDVVVICAIAFAVSVWQSRNMLDVDSSMVVDHQLLVGLDGQTSRLIKPDKVTLIYFFAPWCKVCSLSIGNLEYLDSDKLNIVRVALDYSNVEAVQEFADNHNISSQILLGHAGLKRQFKIQGYPTYYIVDEQQKVLAKSYGYSTALGLKLRQVFSG
jgi:thiol-disulfide isomerase/thioredoxin